MLKFGATYQNTFMIILNCFLKQHQSCSYLLNLQHISQTSRFINQKTSVMLKYTQPIHSNKVSLNSTCKNNFTMSLNNWFIVYKIKINAHISGILKFIIRPELKCGKFGKIWFILWVRHYIIFSIWSFTVKFFRYGSKLL